MTREVSSPTMAALPNPGGAHRIPADAAACGPVAGSWVAELERDTLRAMTAATREGDLTRILTDVARRLGADVGRPTGDATHEVPLNLSVGAGEPLVPKIEATAVSRLLVEQVMPSLVDAAIGVAARLPDRADRV